jgi:lysylphosphatidylglycerol synthetase-like protein (DUF2156 family)
LISKALFWTLINYCFVLVFVLVVDAGLVVAAFLMIIGLALIAPKLPTLGVGSSLGLGKFTLVNVALGSSFSLSAALVDLDGAATALFSTGLAGVAAFVVVGTFSSEIPFAERIPSFSGNVPGFGFTNGRALSVFVQLGLQLP